MALGEFGLQCPAAQALSATIVVPGGGTFAGRVIIIAVAAASP
ncbi:hypothetical protein ABH920_009492, partial [Catenulispora sp. EB89]